MVRLVLSQATKRLRRTSFSAEKYEVTANQEFDLELMPGQEATVLLRIFRVCWFMRARAGEYMLSYASCCFTVLFNQSLLHHWSAVQVLKTRRMYLCQKCTLFIFQIFFVSSLKLQICSTNEKMRGMRFPLFHTAVHCLKMDLKNRIFLDFQRILFKYFLRKLT